MRIEKTVTVTVKTTDGEVLENGNIILYTTKSNPHATMAIYVGLDEKGMICLTDYLTGEEYKKAPNSIVECRIFVTDACKVG